MSNPEYVDVKGLHLRSKVRREYQRHQETHDYLMSIPVDKWPPITLEGKIIIDGLQRVMCARENGITRIPYRSLK